jgi:glycine/D-amino acid oxidase-like deaminating enzyme
MTYDEVDYLIIGQGLAGSILALELLREGKTIRILDNDHRNAASTLAAGIINPITGRRFAKSWRIEEFYPFAKKYYQALEQQFGIHCFHDRSVIRYLKTNKDINDWEGRSSWEGFDRYMHNYPEMESLAERFHLPLGLGRVAPAAQVDLPVLIDSLQKYFLQNDLLIKGEIDHQLSKDDFLNALQPYNAKTIVFCEGYRAKMNPLFQFIPFEPAKGEVLFVRIPGLGMEDIIKNKLMLAPLGEDLYWVGSNYEWNATHEKPTERFLKEFIEKLERTIKIPYEVIDHQAAIRPSIKDRRPVLGFHPHQKQMAIFNGLGTKGASLGPFFARIMSQYLVRGTPLELEYDLKRFYQSV